MTSPDIISAIAFHSLLVICSLTITGAINAFATKLKLPSVATILCAANDNAAKSHIDAITINTIPIHHLGRDIILDLSFSGLGLFLVNGS